MKNQAPWARKLFDEPRIGFVAEHGSQLHPRVKPPEPVEPPPALAPAPLPPGPSPLDKIINEDRRGFAETQRIESSRPPAVVAKLQQSSRKPRSG
jgi:hypothetical protein